MNYHGFCHASAPHGHLQGITDQLGSHTFRHGPANDQTRIEIDHEDDAVALSTQCIKELSNNIVVNFIENRLYSNLLPDNINSSRAKLHFKQIEALSLVFDEALANKVRISNFRHQWDRLPCEYFNNDGDKKLYEEYLVSAGIFKAFVKAKDDYNKSSLAKIECLNGLSGFKNSRIVISRWLEGLLPEKS
jgi:hypothetical protein